MGDNDRFSNQPRYGGGGGGRKRRYQDFDEGQGGGGGGGGRDGGGRPYQQRRRFDPPGTRLRKKLLSLLDSSVSSPEQEVAEAASIAIHHAHDEYVQDTFVDLVSSLALEQPAKTVFVAAVVRAVNASKPDLVRDWLDRFALTLNREVRRGRWREVKLGLRLLASLPDIIEGDGVLLVLDDLFQRVIDLQSSNPEETLGPELTKIILFTIPYLMAAPGSEGMAGKVDELLEKTDVVASTTHALEGLVEPYPSADAEKPMGCPSLLSILQRQLQEEAANGWTLACIPRVAIDATTPNGKTNGDANGTTEADANGDTNGDADMNEASTKHALPAITLPEILNPGQKALFPEIYYSAFADQEVESVPPTSNIASTLIRDVIVDSINTLDVNRSFVGKLIIELDNFWAPGTFVKRATPFDKLRDIIADKPKWKPEDMAIDAVFSQLLQLPAPVHKTVYYHSIIMEACKLAPSAIAPSLGRAIRFTYRTLPQLDLELVQRFTDWFAHHVSNFEFRWKWTEWTPDVALSNLAAKKAFILATIDKEIRLSFPKRIADSLPPDFSSLIVKGQYNDEPDYKFADPSTPYANEGQALLSVLKDKSSTDADIQNILDQVRGQAESQGEDADSVSTDVLVTAICHIGSKSLSHILSAIEKNRERLLAIGPASEAARRQIITSVTSYWTHHPGQAVNIIDKLLNYTIVTPASVIQWALSDRLEGGAGLARHNLLEMVWSTMGKVARRVGDIAAARANPDILAAGNDEHVKVIEETLVRERQNMRDLFAAIQDAVRPLTNGDDGLGSGGHDGDDDPAALTRAWAAKWSRTWARRAAVEEARSGEDGVRALVRVLADVAAVEREVKADEEAERLRRDEARAKREEERRRRYEEGRAAAAAAAAAAADGGDGSRTAADGEAEVTRGAGDEDRVLRDADVDEVL